jgi:hypothetical protein
MSPRATLGAKVEWAFVKIWGEIGGSFVVFLETPIIINSTQKEKS